MRYMNEIKDYRSILRRQHLDAVIPKECTECEANALFALVGALQQYVTDEQWRDSMERFNDAQTMEDHHEWGIP